MLLRRPLKPGEEDGRRGEKELFAVTRVEIHLSSQENTEKCLRHLEESDRRLRMIKSNPWDWQRVERLGTRIRFGVAWYDRSFFEQRKTAWSDPKHASLYAEFGATPENFKVTHEIIK